MPVPEGGGGITAVATFCAQVKIAKNYQYIMTNCKEIHDYMYMNVCINVSALCYGLCFLICLCVSACDKDNKVEPDEVRKLRENCVPRYILSNWRR